MGLVFFCLFLGKIVVDSGADHAKDIETRQAVVPKSIRCPKAVPIEWPPRSPDMTPPDFFLWGYVKNVVYSQKPQTLEELKQSISQCFNQIPTDMLARACQSVPNRCQLCVENKGGQFEFQRS